MSKLNNATIVQPKATNFFAKPKVETQALAQQVQTPILMPVQQKIEQASTKLNNKPNEKQRGRPKNTTETKDAKLSLSLSAKQKDLLTKALESYNNSKKDDIFFKSLSMNEFVVTVLFSSSELNKLIGNYK
jgi:hypothetical protein